MKGFESAVMLSGCAVALAVQYVLLQAGKAAECKTAK